jgi:hypothetical protein
LEGKVKLSSTDESISVEGDDQIAGPKCKTISKQRTIQVIHGKMMLGTQTQVSFFIYLCYYTISRLDLLSQK